MKWRDLKIRNKLLSAFGIIILLVSLLIIRSFIGVNLILRHNQSLEESGKIKEIFLERHNDHLKWGQKICNVLLNSGLPKLDVEKNPHNCAFGRWFYGEGRTQAESLAPELKDKFKELETAHLHLHETTEEIDKFLSDSNREQAVVIFRTKTTNYLKEIGTLITGIHDGLNQKIEGIKLEIQENNITQRRNTILIGFLALFATIILTWLITNSLTKGMINIVNISKQIASGKLNATLDKEYLARKDEIGEMAQSFHDTVMKLKEVIGQISEGANNIAIASVEISNGSQVIAESANKQATASEELASTFEELSSNVQQHTVDSKETESVALNSFEKFQEGTELTGITVEAIHNIASRISIISEIAFQTNLLALNAAVEAARAGETGRGFAVVASEVKRLADKSKIAAEDIVSLSSKGIEQAQVAGNKMLEIVPMIERTTSLIQGIISAGVEQNSGLEQINGAVQLLNQTAQENAATSEQLSTNAEGLANLAQETKKIVSFFRIS